MQLSVYGENLGWGGSWRSLTKGMIRHNSGPVEQVRNDFFGAIDLRIDAGNAYGITLQAFIGGWSGTLNDEGTGTVAQPWVIGLKPGAMEWSIV